MRPPKRCAVEGCATAPTGSIDLTKVGGNTKIPFALHWLVCDFHHRALMEGEPFTLSEDQNTIIMGATGVPPRLMRLRVQTNGLADPVITFAVGHDGMETGEWKLQASREFAHALLDAVRDHDSALSKELHRNRTEQS